MTEMKRSAVISECGKYRYRLYREWGVSHLKPLMWLMLNPSTADADIDDATILKCIKFSTTWGYGSMWVGNLYAYRSTDPKALKSLSDEEKQGPLLEPHLRGMIGDSDAIVAGWGNHGVPSFIHRRILKDANLMCLVVNKNKSPKHPLYIKDTTSLIPYRWLS